jgi:hypothetical protein
MRKMEAVCFSEMLVPTWRATWYHNTAWIFTAVKTSDLIPQILHFKRMFWRMWQCGVSEQTYINDNTEIGNVLTEYRSLSCVRLKILRQHVFIYGGCSHINLISSECRNYLIGPYGVESTTLASRCESSVNYPESAGFVWNCCSGEEIIHVFHCTGCPETSIYRQINSL